MISMPRAYDIIVLGLGGMGSAAVYHLASRGLKVLGLEQFTPAHDKGASHGKSRVIRQSYYEDPAYVPLLLRSYDGRKESVRKERTTVEVIGAQNMIFAMATFPASISSIRTPFS